MSEIEKNEEEIDFLECERWWIFALLITVAGYFGAFTYSIRGGIFCNAQTANFVLFAMALGNMDWEKAIYYVIPMSAYLLGAMISESFALRIKKYNLLRWDTVLIGFELIVAILLGFLPEKAPVQISQVAINFICSMQYNTFRQAQKVPMATTFCTNHLRQAGIHIVKWIRKKEQTAYMKRSMIHFGMLFMFVVGAVVSTVMCRLFLGKAIWGAAVLLGIIFVDLIHADLTKEKGLLYRKPAGH